MEIAELISCLSYPPSSRSSDMITRMVELTANVKFFQQLTADNRSNELHRSCCSVMTLQRFAAGKDIITFGTEGLTFYIIVRGTATVFVPYRERFHTETHEDERTEAGTHSMKAVSTLAEGSAFGELALLSDKPRAATVRAQEEVVAAVLTKNQFKALLAGQTRKALEDVYRFLQSIPVFRLYARESLYKLSYYAKTIVLHRHQKLFSESDEADALYLVRKGELELTKKVVLSSNSVLKSRPTDTTPEKSTVASKTVRTLKRVMVCTKGISEIIGLEELTKNTRARTYSCACVSTTAEVLRISKEDFMLRVPHSDTWNSLKQRGEEEANRLQRRLKAGIQVEFSKNSFEVEPRPIQTSCGHRSGSDRIQWKSYNCGSAVRIKKHRLSLTSNRMPAVCQHPFSKPKEYTPSIFKRKRKEQSLKKQGPPANFYHGILNRLKRRYEYATLRNTSR